MSLRSNNQWSALELAASYGHVGVMRGLVQHGADVMSFGPDGKTALQLAARKNQAGAMGVLVKAGTDVTSRDRNGSTVLHLVSWNRVDAVNVLAEVGADVDARLEDDDEEWTPLH